MKLISYAHVCNDVRRHLKATNRHTKKSSKSSRRSGSKKAKGVSTRLRRRNRVESSDEDEGGDSDSSGKGSTDATSSVSAQAELFPDGYDPNLQHLFYFMCAPTLVFQWRYPRSNRIRRRFVIRRLFEIILCLSLIIFISKQYVEPTVKNFKWIDAHVTVGPYRRYLHLVERLCKLAIPNGAIWLLMFYGFFHSWLNLTGELLRFGDRLFYKDWWYVFMYLCIYVFI